MFPRHFLHGTEREPCMLVTSVTKSVNVQVPFHKRKLIN
jgi:hypothetical protein